MLENLELQWDAGSWICVSLVLLLAINRAVLVNILSIYRIPGPRLYAATKWRLAYEDWQGSRTRTIHKLHEEYGPVVRVGPHEISFNSLLALKTIYGAGSGFERTSFYRMFDVYGEQNLFTFASSKTHGDRKKLLNHAYSKSNILKFSAVTVEEKVWNYMQFLERSSGPNEIFSSLHYYALDNITHFLYGKDHGATSSLAGSVVDRALLDDVLDPARRKLSWFATHLPKYTKWLMTRGGFVEKVISILGLLPQKKPTVYTGIRRHALASFKAFSAASSDVKTASRAGTIVGRLWESHCSKKETGLSDMELASEVADHLLAGVDTTSDTLMFLKWALSRPEAIPYQKRLIEEVLALPESALDASGIPRAEAAGKLLFLDAVIKETLRLYAPLPASEPRCLPVDTVIDGHKIPAHTVVSISPYTLHRNPEVFPNPQIFDPERWLSPEEDLAEMKKWFWAFSSGGRMCIGIHLAMAEMTTLTAAIYRVYRTSLSAGTETASPGITSRFEVFYDETLPTVKEHVCLIDFKKHGTMVSRI